MPNVGQLNATATLNTAQFKAAVSALNSLLLTTGTKTSGAVNQGFGEVNKTLKTTSDRIWNVRTGIKDITKVASGIIMSQFIYQGLIAPLRNAVSALFEFNSYLEKSIISFKYLLKDIGLAKNMIADLEEIAARTPFTFETAANAARRLLAFGFNPNQINPMMEIMADLATVTGGDAVASMEALSHAFGVVQARGRLTMKELILFTTANIPVFKILQEQLGLTAKDMVKLKIPADVALPAILKGLASMQGAAKEAEKTIPGLLSSIHDYALFLGQDLLGRFWESVRTVLSGIRDTLMNLREAIKAEGIYGFITAFFPPEMRQTMVIFIRGIQELVKALGSLFKSFGPVILMIMEFGARMASVVIPPIIALIRWISGLIQSIMQSTGFMRILITVLGSLGIAVVVAGFVGMLAKAITLLGIASGVSTLITWLTRSVSLLGAALMSNPWAALATLIVGAIVYIAMTSSWGASMIDKLTSSIGRLVGVEGNVVRSTGSYVQAMNEQNNKLRATKMTYADLINSFGSGAEEAGNTAEEAGNKIKDTFLASFDEVYNIPDPTESLAGALAGLGGLGDMAMPDFGTIADDIGAIDDALSNIQPINWSNILGSAALAYIFAQAWRDILRWLQNLWKKITDWFKNNKINWQMPNLQEAFAYAWNALSRALTEALARAKQWGIDLSRAFNLNFIPNFNIDWAAALKGLLTFPAKVLNLVLLPNFKIDWVTALNNFQAAMPNLGLLLGAIIVTSFHSANKMIGDWFIGIGDNIAKWWNNIAWDKVYNAVEASASQLVKALAVAIVLFFAAAVDIPAIITAIVTWFGKIITGLLEPASVAGASVGSAVVIGHSPGGIVNGILDNAPAVVVALLKVVLDAITNVLINTIQEAIDLGVRLITSLVNGMLSMSVSVANTVQSFYNILETKMVQAKNNMVIWVRDLWTNFIQGTTNKMNEMNAKILEVYTIVSTKMIQAKDNMVTWVRDMWTNFIQGTTNKIGEITTRLLEVYTVILTKMIEAKNNMINWVRDIWDNFIKGTTDKIEDIKLVIQGIIDAIAKQFTNTWEDAKDWGKGILEGFMSGLQDKWRETTDKITEIGEDIVKKAKSAFKINSPSKVFAEIGSGVMEGFGEGLINGANALKSLNMDGQMGKIAYGNVIGRDTVSNMTPNNSVNDNSSLVRAIISAINGSNSNVGGTPRQQNNIADNYVLVPIDKRQLNRELYVLQQAEVLRRGA